jgi:hypothetical protein
MNSNLHNIFSFISNTHSILDINNTAVFDVSIRNINTINTIIEAPTFENSYYWDDSNIWDDTNVWKDKE